MVDACRSAAIRHRSEEAGAAISVVLAVTASSALMIGVFQAVSGSLPLVAAPAAAVILALAIGRTDAALWASVAAWVVITPLAPGIGIAAPLFMITLCGALAIGPDRAIDWMAGDWTGRRVAESSTSAGWIEDDTRVR